ncbi:hypothetical protein PR202_gb17460 [Eleusine coracana subsp. coracana]|uniref:Uncharacterized protein n=1 Tax=Eleusine coracana subsp. coracana TaxID=191504 RepID=A0AAV5F2Z9_ELECO|nr:hypothetical protein PR202_gb17460 [Eleusine coracana subsp. coracana]
MEERRPRPRQEARRQPRPGRARWRIGGPDPNGGTAAAPARAGPVKEQWPGGRRGGSGFVAGGLAGATTTSARAGPMEEALSRQRTWAHDGRSGGRDDSAGVVAEAMALSPPRVSIVESARRPFPAAGVDDVSAEAAAPAFLTADRDRPVDPTIWGDEKRMKRELLAWAKATSMAVQPQNATLSSARCCP